MAIEIRQIPVGAMAVFCYVVHDSEEKVCALVDPAFETEKILGIVAEMGLRVIHVINTHAHPDHTSGNRSVIDATGATLLVHSEDAKKLGSLMGKALARMFGGKPSPKPDVLLEDGSIIKIGSQHLEVIHTPGHTPGGICLYTPGHLITGDTLFVGGVGRTDLPGASGKKLIESIRKRLLVLPDDTRVWPGHNYGTRPGSTIGWEKLSNPFLFKDAD